MDVCLCGLNRHSGPSGAPQGPTAKRTSSHQETLAPSHICYKHTLSRFWAFICLFALVIWGPHIITLAGREPSGFVGNPHWFFCLLRLSMAAFLWLHHRIDDKDTSTRLNLAVLLRLSGSGTDRSADIRGIITVDIWASDRSTLSRTHTAHSLNINKP